VITERVLAQRPLVLDQTARERYFSDGVLPGPGYVGGAWLARLRAIVVAKVEEPRTLTAMAPPPHILGTPRRRRGVPR
jgi:hypothetical protein